MEANKITAFAVLACRHHGQGTCAPKKSRTTTYHAVALHGDAQPKDHERAKLFWQCLPHLTHAQQQALAAIQASPDSTKTTFSVDKLLPRWLGDA